MLDAQTAPTVPTTLAELLDPAWLTGALAPLTGGADVTWVGDVDNFETMAAKVRFAVRLEGQEAVQRFCLKVFLNEAGAGAGATAVREADFYLAIAPRITTRVPRAAAVIDREGPRAALVMDDLTTVGVRFCSALEPFTPALAAESVDQIARLHAGSHLLDDPAFGWLPDRLAHIAARPHFDAAQLQQLLDDPRSATLAPRTRSAATLLAGMKRLAERFAGRERAILHGDCHAGNFYLTADGRPGLTDWQLVQRGHWAQDVAYHIAAVLPEEVAAREERGLVRHYVERVVAHGGTAPDPEQAWDDYRAAQLYGFYHWAITRRVEPAITNIFCARLGAGIERHDSYGLLGV